MATRGRLNLPAYIRAFALAGIAGARRGGPVVAHRTSGAREKHTSGNRARISSRCWPRVSRNMTAGRALASPWAVAICAAIRRVVGRVAGRRECGARNTCARRPHDARVGHPRRHCSGIASTMQAVDERSDRWFVSDRPPGIELPRQPMQLSRRYKRWKTARSCSRVASIACELPGNRQRPRRYSAPRRQIPSAALVLREAWATARKTPRARTQLDER